MRAIGMEACGALESNVSPLFYTEVLTLSLFYASLWSNRVDARPDRAAAVVRRPCAAPARGVAARYMVDSEFGFWEWFWDEMR